MNEKELKKRLVAKRKKIKDKLALLKQTETMQEKIFNPITRQLKSIDEKLNKHDSNSKITDEYNEFKLIPEDNDDDNESNETTQEDHEMPEISTTETSSRFQDIEKAAYLDYLEQYNPLPRKYISGMYDSNKEKKFDHKYGVRLDKNTEALFIGNTKIIIDGNDIIVKGRRYKGTPGLYELLFKKKPHSYTPADKENYIQIIKRTNAHRRYYRSNEQIDGSKLKKYKNIIRPSVNISGKGVFNTVTNNKIDYVHWDDPNELVDRLRLLLASQTAGNTSHTNEINSIIEELKEANIIE